jgi:O-antigen/teichoic acid export membrane protein
VSGAEALARTAAAHKRWVTAFVRNGGLLMGSSVVQSLAGFASQLLLMRLLVPADFGEFSLALASASLILVVLSPRLGILAIRARDAEYTEEFRHRLNSAMAIEAVASLVVMLIWLASIGVRSAWAYPLAATLALGHWVSSVTTFYERDLPYGRIAAIETGSQIVCHAAAVAFAVAGAGIASLYLREMLMVVVRSLLLARIGALPRWRLHWVTLAEWRVMIKEARVPWLDGIVDGGFQRLTILVVGALGGAHVTGLVVQAQRLALVPHQILAPVVVRLAGNVFSRIEAGGDRRRTLGHVAALVSLPLTIAAAAAWAFAGPVVPWLFGAGWIEAGPVLASMAGVVLGFSLFELGRSYCLAQRLNLLLLTGRAVQYGVFAAGCLLVAAQPSAAKLGLILSVVAVMSAATILLGLAMKRGEA